MSHHEEAGMQAEKRSTVESQHEAGSDKGGFSHKLEHATPGYGMERSKEASAAILNDEDNNPYIHHHVRWQNASIKLCAD